MVMVLIRWWMCALCLVSIGVNAGQLSTRYSYDEAGNKNSQTDALGHITRWTYSLTNQITSRTLPDGSTESFSYDSQGNRTSYTDFNGQITRYAYDLNDRLTLTQYPDGRSIKTTYAPSGQTETLTESQTIAGKTTAKVTRYSYDIMDRLLKVEYPNKQVITYSYDAAGRLLSRSTVNGTSRYTYDVMDNLITVADTLGQVTTYEYDAVGNKTRRTLPNGQYSTYGYNSRHQLTEINHFRADQSLIGCYQYTLNETGLRTAVTETQADINQASQNHTRTLTYNYDSLNRLSQETAIDADNAFGGSYSRTYHYDSVGNRSQQVHSYTNTQGQAATITTDYNYDANDQLLAETIHSPTLTDTISYQYDKNGNLTQKTNQNGVLARYHYTTDNKLSLIEQGNLSIRYAYDSQGNRIQSITTDSSQTTPKTETVAYLVDNNFSYPEVIEEQDAQGKLITSNTFVPKGVGDLLSINRANQGTYYGSEDALGSLRQLTNTQGKVEAQQQTTAWGEVLPISNMSQYTAYGYTGERQDDKTGLVYLRAREYAPNVGRFVQRDSWAGAPKKPITLNQYVYANADGVNFKDPTGKSTDLMSVNTAIAGAAILTAGLIAYESVQASNHGGFNLMRMTEAIYNGDTTSLETGILTLLSTSMSGPLLTILYNQSVRDDTPAGDSRDLTAAANAEIEEIGKGRYTAYVRCHIKKGVRSIGFTKEGIGRGPSLAIAITNGQASANQTCPSGTQARHCKARLCLKDSTVIPCPNLGN